MSELDEEGKFRHLTGFLGLIQRVLFITIPVCGILFVLQIHLYFRKAFFKEQYLAIFLGLVLASIFIGVSGSRKASRSHVPWYDTLLAGISLGIAFFCCAIYPDYLLSGMAYLGPEYIVLAVLDILLVMEAARRMTGWTLLVLTTILIFYARFNDLLPAPFASKGIPWDQVLLYLFLDGNGLLGLPLWVSSVIIFAFILFGEFLFFTGGGQLFSDFATATCGRFRGGPAKVSVVASGLFGTISGSAVANVMVDGWLTIPMMKKTGYSPPAAGAIEAAASTGGQLMPPIMGVTAFIIAEFLSISYAEVAIAAAIPAVLYYFALFFQVDLEAGKKGLKGLSGELPRLGPIARKSWTFVVPMAVLICTLFILNLQPERSALAAIASLFVISFLTRKTRIGLRGVINIFERTGKGLLMVGATTAIAGLIIGAIYLTGLGTLLSTSLLNLGSQELFLMLLITAVLCIILGMGMPTGVLYIILVVLVGPPMVKAGVVPLAAHLFIFYFGLMSMITPPICFAAYAAAAIAGTGVWQTGLYACRFGVAAYIVPFIFVYSPGLLLIGGITDIFAVVLKSFLGISFISIACSGFLFQNLGWGKRTSITFGAVALMIPSGAGFSIPSWLLNILGAAVSLAIVFWEWHKYRAGPNLHP